MTEAEKMLAGLPYDIMAPELKALRRKAHEAVYAYNRSDPQEDEPPSAILQDLLGSLGRDGFVETPFRCARSEERRVGKECVRTCRSRVSADQSKKNTKTNKK